MRRLGLALVVLGALVTADGCGDDSSVGVDLSVADLPPDFLSDPCGLTGGTCVVAGSCGAGQGYLSSLGTLACPLGSGLVCCYPTCSGTPVETACCDGARPVCDSASKQLECAGGPNACTVDVDGGPSNPDAGD